MRTSTPKFQQSNGFRRGQPVVRSGGRFVLATEATGFDGLVGSILSADQFELVTSGELDGVPALLVPGDGSVWYLSSTPGVLALSGTTQVCKVFGQTVLLVPTGGASSGGGGITIPWSGTTPITTAFRSAGSPGASVAGLVHEDHKHPLDLGSTLTRLADASEAGIAMVLAATPDDQEGLLGLRYLRATLARYMTLNGLAHTGERVFTFPDQDGTIAVLEREQTFTFRQHVTGLAPTGLVANEVQLGGGTVVIGAELGVGAMPTTTAFSVFDNAQKWVQFKGIGPTPLPGTGHILTTETLIGGGKIWSSNGIRLFGGDIITRAGGGEPRPSPIIIQAPSSGFPADGLHLMFANKLGYQLAHIGISNNENGHLDVSFELMPQGMRFASSFGRLADWLTYVTLYGANPNTAVTSQVLVGGGYVFAGQQVSAGLLTSGIRTYMNTTEIGISNYGVGGASIQMSANNMLFSVDNGAMQLSAFSHIEMTPATSGLVRMLGATAPTSVTAPEVAIGDGRIWSSGTVTIGPLGKGSLYAGSWFGRASAPGDGARITLGDGFELSSPSGTSWATWTSGDNCLTVIGTAPSSVASGEVKIGGGQVWAKNLVMAYAGADTGSDTFGAAVQLGCSADNGGAYFQLGAGYHLDLWSYNAGWAKSLRVQKDGVSIFYGTAPSTIGSGEVKIAGGRVWSGQNGGGPGLILSDTAGGGRRWELYVNGNTANALAIYNRTDNNYPIEWLSDGRTVFRGAAAGTPAANTVEIGGGYVQAANTIFCGGGIYAGNGSYVWKMSGYTAGAPAATGYATITINGTTYKLLCST